MPEFTYSTSSLGVKCTVTLPTDALVQIVEGRPTSSQADAKRIACLDACKCLYFAGALTDHLLLKSDEDENPLNTTTAPESSSVNKGKEYALFSIRLPFGFLRFCLLCPPCSVDNSSSAVDENDSICYRKIKPNL